MQQTEPTNDLDTIRRYIQRVKGAPAGKVYLSNARKRRFVGAILGATSGFMISLLSELANPLLLGGIPLDQPPFGPLGNLVFNTCLGALIGLASAWPSDSAFGIAAGIITLVLSLESRHLLILNSGSVNPYQVGAQSALAVACLPLMLLYLLPAPVLLRLATERVEEFADFPLWHWRRNRLAIILLAASLIAGGLAVYPAPVRQGLRQVHQLVQAGLAAGSQEALPPALNTRLVESFWDNASLPYRLTRDKTYLVMFETRQIMARTDAEYHNQFVIAVRFADNWRLLCLIPYPGAEPYCRSLPEVWYR